MAITKFTAGTTICNEGDSVDALYVIGAGKVDALFPGGEMTLQKGDIIGIQDMKTGKHSCSYMAQTDVAVVPYPYTGFDALMSLFSQKPDIMHLFFTASSRFSSLLLTYCSQYLREEESEEEEEGDILPTAEDDEPEDIEMAREVIPVDESDLPEALKDALKNILDFSGADEELAANFTREVEEFKAMEDKESTDDQYRKLRQSLTKDYYQVYQKAFEASLAVEKVPPIIRLFLTFGLVDVHLAGISNSVYLLGLIDNYHGDPSRGVYTYYEWLKAIYEGKKEPSRNEFDLDYPAWLREQKSQGVVSEKQMKMLLNSRIDMVRFEMQNVFPIMNKMTYGRITTFVPVLSEHTLIKALPDIIVTPHRVAQTIKSIKSIDFSAFYRETSFSNEKAGVVREQIDVEVLPDVILAPNAGVRGAMWQEIEGKRRTTPARMILSVMGLEDIKKLMLRMTAEFRWEMCKRIQGAHWNNIAERSLTSEYCDYAQFYKRNHELSPEAKEKIKLALQRAKNSMKGMFVGDYMNWITYEGNGAPRLNKFAREILFTYCPFPAAIRENLAQHPLYSKLIERYKLKSNQKLHHIEVLETKVAKAGKRLPMEIERQREFLKL